MAEDSKIYGFLGVFLPIIGLIIIMLTKKDDKYAMYYAKQGLMLGIVWILVGVIARFLLFSVSFLYWIISAAMWILWIIGWVYALQGEMKPIPLIGVYAEKWFKDI